MYRLIVACLTGIGVGLLLPSTTNLDNYFQVLLPILIFSVGCSMGEFNIKENLTKSWKFVFFPIISLVGSIIGAYLCSQIFNVDTTLSVLSGGAMGFYSLPAVMVSSQVGAIAGTIVLVVNMLREGIAIIFAPVLKELFGRYSIIAVGGATTMDVSLSIVKETLGNNYVTLSIINGLILTIIVPFIMSVFIYFI
jgi:uncharacterized membrane protein YbjE (DUF340 family)